jgi:DNA-binding LacI/PurR family transcriptional regulator
VSVDHTLGQYLATAHLVNGGWRRIAYLRWPGVSDSLNKRVAGYRALLSEHTNQISPEHVVAGDPRDESLVRSIMNGLKPDAILCENDLLASHLMQTLSKLGHSIPRDVGVVGFNDVGLAQHLETPLTSVRQPCQEIGNAAVDLMVWRLENRESAGRTLLLNPQLIVRASSMRPAS